MTSPIPTEGGKSAARELRRACMALYFATEKSVADDISRKAKAVLDQHAALLAAAQTVLDGLNERIDTAPLSAVPVFAGIADLHSAILQATGGEDVR